MTIGINEDTPSEKVSIEQKMAITYLALADVPEIRSPVKTLQVSIAIYCSHNSLLTDKPKDCIRKSHITGQHIQNIRNARTCAPDMLDLNDVSEPAGHPAYRLLPRQAV